MTVVKVIMIVGTLAILSFLMSCVSASRYKRDMRMFYKDGLHMGVVLGRQDVLNQLREADCYTQRIDDLVNPDSKEPK